MPVSRSRKKKKKKRKITNMLNSKQLHNTWQYSAQQSSIDSQMLDRLNSICVKMKKIIKSLRQY